jgi:hypothetical protein
VLYIRLVDITLPRQNKIFCLAASVAYFFLSAVFLLHYSGTNSDRAFGLSYAPNPLKDVPPTPEGVLHPKFRLPKSLRFQADDSLVKHSFLASPKELRLRAVHRFQ